MLAMVMAGDGLRQVGDIGELAGLGRVREVGGQLVELIRCAGVAILLGRLSRALQVCRDLLRNLLILRGVRLLKLLQ